MGLYSQLLSYFILHDFDFRACVFANSLLHHCNPTNENVSLSVFNLPSESCPIYPGQSSTARGRQRFLVGRLGRSEDRLCRHVLVLCVLISDWKITGSLVRPPLAPRCTREGRRGQIKAKQARFDAAVGPFPPRLIFGGRHKKQSAG